MATVCGKCIRYVCARVVHSGSGCPSLMPMLPVAVVLPAALRCACGVVALMRRVIEICKLQYIIHHECIYHISWRWQISTFACKKLSVNSAPWLVVVPSPLSRREVRLRPLVSQ